VASGECERGFVFGGSGNGEAMVANTVTGVRCAYVWNSQTAELGRRHNDANVMAVGQRMISEYIMLELVQIFLNTAFEGGRHIERIREIE
jgi:ribose 5-phosphate isomerase B